MSSHAKLQPKRRPRQEGLEKGWPSGPISGALTRSEKFWAPLQMQAKPRFKWSHILSPPPNPICIPKSQDSDGSVCMHIYMGVGGDMGGRQRGSGCGCGTHLSSLICCYLPVSTLCCNHSQQFPGNILPYAFHSTGMPALACPMFS